MPSVASVLLNVSFIVAHYQYSLVIRALYGQGTHSQGTQGQGTHGQGTHGQGTHGQPHTPCLGYLIALFLFLQSPPHSSHSELLRGLTGIH